MDQKVAMISAMLASMMFFASAAEDLELMEMRDAVVAVGGDWAAIEGLLSTLPQEDRDLVIDTYPERIAELEEIRRSIEESGANWTAGLNPVFLLPPERRRGVGTFQIPAEAEGVSREIVTIGQSEGGPKALVLPSSWDWRSASGHDWTTPIKDQGQCGSCWAFGALGAIESRVKLASDNPGLVPDFSEQYLLSCSPGDCGGWYIDLTADWILCQGTVDEACFPYSSVDTIPCSDSCFDRDSRKYKSEGWGWVCGDWNIVDVNQIKQEILSGGPVPTFMDVYTDFDAYTGGVYRHTYGSYRGGHCVDIVGWGNDGVDDYWICKNSWGTDWGESGWFKIKMGEVSIGTQVAAYQPKVRGKVLFYEGHVPMSDFQLSNGYSEWGNILASNGYLVHSTTMTPLTSSLLDCYDMIVISNPTNTFTSSEINAIKEFVGRGRVIGSGDGSWLSNDAIYLQDNERMAVEYVDWLVTGEGGGLFVMGERQIANTAANQIAKIFGLKFNSDIIYDPKRYDTSTNRPILGPEDDVEVLASCSLSISKDASVLARATSSGYASAALARDGSGADDDLAAAVESYLAPEEMPPVKEASGMEI
ncbi:MAG: Peptidase C1A, papain, putative [Methanothrix harundinacea]|uniref:Peptidase C1A, papain, putative n=1 Tax=Methanothrix harundinacea TaxID=301375 RepID=A0A124G2T7_9EURY|nr:MAG: Peptidase C1A, papain, putative [Methanothrix harundinacea]